MNQAGDIEIEQWIALVRNRIRSHRLDLGLGTREMAKVCGMSITEAGIPPEQFKLVFKRVAARLATYKSQGKNLTMISVYNWLIGWAKSDVVKELTDSCNLERSKVYLAGAKL